MQDIVNDMLNSVAILLLTHLCTYCMTVPTSVCDGSATYFEALSERSEGPVHGKYESVSLNVSQHVKLNQKHATITFSAYNKTFILKLTEQEQRILAPELTIQIGIDVLTKDEMNDLNMSTIVKGYVQNVKNSYVYGKFEDNYMVFEAYFRIENISYFIEPCSKYDAKQKSPEPCCLVYRDIDLDTTNKTKVDLSDDEYAHNVNFVKTHPGNFRYIDEQRRKNVDKTRFRRSTTESHSCTLHTVADHTFYENIGGGSISRTVSEIVYMVSIADLIFRGTDFDGNGIGDNLGFTINAITIYPTTSTSDYLMKNSDDVMDYLDQFSKYDFSSFCLGYAFSYRDFASGVVGLAYVGNSDQYGAAGGICQPRVRWSSGTLFSFNTGLITQLNYESRVTSYQSALTLAHEFGHSFGSSHDKGEPSTCAPDDQYGNFIMFPYSMDGSLANHNKFSTCSTNSIYPVIINKGQCLVTSTGPICGNRAVEDGEECDCGTNETCRIFGNKCCVPSDGQTGSDLPCTFRRNEGKVCSPILSPCCDVNCAFILATDNHKCSTETECRQATYCNGTTSKCPDGERKPDGDLCDSDRKSCRGGLCLSGVCETNGLVTCQCKSVDDLCKVCCREANSTICQPGHVFNVLDSMSITAHRKTGEACKNNTGVCDAVGECILKDHDSIMNRITGVFDKENLIDFKTWLKNYWYYLIISFFCAAFLIFIFIVTKKRMDNTHIVAYRTGRFMRVMEEAEKEKTRHTQIFEEIDSRYASLLAKVKQGQEQREFTQAIGRLGSFFPTVPTPMLSNIVNRCSSEEVAVRLLLIKGYPIKRMIRHPKPPSAT